LPETATVPDFDRYRIAPVILRIARSPEFVGRIERFDNSLKLLRRLDVVGRRRLVVLEMIEDSGRVSELLVDALNHYLRTGHGLRYFRRGRHLCSDAFAWSELRALVGFPPIDAHKPTSQIPA
jgi:hypothetical protein